MRSIRCEPGRADLIVTDDWLQGRSAFGGLQAALGVRAMRTLVPAGVPLRVLQVTFVAPVPPGAARARARVLRTGKSATHVEAQLADGDQLLATLIGVFGAPRPSVIAHVPQRPPVAATTDIRMPWVSGLTPAFMQHFATRWRRGAPPYSANPSHDMVVELDLLDPGAATEAHAIAIADFVPPVALSMLASPTPGSSLTWMLELLVDRYDDLTLAGWRIDSQLVAARDGYTSQSNLVWGPTGNLVGISRQSMVVFG